MPIYYDDSVHAAYIGIGGTAKKIKNIYIGVGGVARQVKSAYIGIGGTAKKWYSSKLPTLAELFADMVVDCWNFNQYDEMQLDSYELSYWDPYYLFVMRGSASNIFYLDSVSDGNFTLLNKDGSATFTMDIDGRWITTESSSYYGGVMAAVRFPGYSDTDIQNILSSMTFSRKAYANTSSTTTVRTAYSGIKSEAVYIAPFANLSSDLLGGISFSLGSSYTTPIFSQVFDYSQNKQVSKNYSFLYKSGSYVYLSPTGSSSGSIRNGSIHELSLSS